MKNIKILVSISVLLITVLACNSKKELAGNEKYILGKWQSKQFVFDFLKDGKLRIHEGDKIADLNYIITNENSKIYLQIINMGDTSKIKVDSISKSYMRLAPIKNPNDTKEFRKID